MRLSLYVFATLLLGVTTAVGPPPRHGTERIVVEKKKEDGMQFQTFSGNDTEQMFKTVKGDDMNITMQTADVQTTGYVSEEVKDQQVYKYYNNTNFFVTFRETYLSQVSVKQLSQLVVKQELLKNKEITKVRVKKLYKTYAVFELGS